MAFLLPIVLLVTMLGGAPAASQSRASCSRAGAWAESPEIRAEMGRFRIVATRGAEDRRIYWLLGSVRYKGDWQDYKGAYFGYGPRLNFVPISHKQQSCRGSSCSHTEQFAIELDAKQTFASSAAGRSLEIEPARAATESNLRVQVPIDYLRGVQALAEEGRCLSAP
jgi:hypothetical protein